MPKSIAQIMKDASTLNSNMTAYFNSKDGKAALAKQYTGYGGKKITGQEAFTKACMKSGPFDAFENLDPTLRDMAANKQLLSIEQWIKDAKDPEELTNKLIEEGFLHNPAMRLGIARSYQLNGFAGKGKDFFRDVDNALSQKVFTDTLAPMTKEEQEKYISESKDPVQAKKDLERHQESQKVMMKMLYAAQMGESVKYDDKGKKEPWPNNVSEMFMSGQRVGFILPPVTETNKDASTLKQKQPDATTPEEGKRIRDNVVDAFYGKDKGKDAGNKERATATHSVKLKSFDLKQKYEEIKVSLKTGIGRVFGKQFGMDIAAGGLGKPGPGGRIENDGTCGHMYSHINPGDSKHNGALLVGFESESPLKLNRFGHKHGFTAKPEQQSCFGTQKDNTVGAKYGGREVDLSGLNAKKFVTDMEMFDVYLTSRMKNLHHENETVRKQAAEDLRNVGGMLAGTYKGKDFQPIKSTLEATAIQPISLGPDDLNKEAQKEEKKEIPPENLGRQSKKPLPPIPTKKDPETVKKAPEKNPMGKG